MVLSWEFERGFWSFFGKIRFLTFFKRKIEGFGTDLGIWWYFLMLIINNLNLFLGISWYFRGNLVGIWWGFGGDLVGIWWGFGGDLK